MPDLPGVCSHRQAQQWVVNYPLQRDVPLQLGELVRAAHFCRLGAEQNELGYCPLLVEVDSSLLAPYRALTGVECWLHRVTSGIHREMNVRDVLSVERSIIDPSVVWFNYYC